MLRERGFRGYELGYCATKELLDFRFGTTATSSLTHSQPPLEITSLPSRFPQPDELESLLTKRGCRAQAR